MKESLLKFNSVSMTYATSGRTAGEGRRVLSDVSFAIAPSRAVALVGRSGSGKSTLLHLAAGIMVPTSGQVVLDGRDLGAMSEKKRTVQRRASVGQVFQFFHLLPHLTVAENIALPGWIAGDSSSSSQARTSELLQRVGLEDRSADPVGQLSGGEMQRVAICRALFRRPALVLADEPTGSLDDGTGLVVMNLLLELVRDEGATLLYVTHSRDLARRADTVWNLANGRLDNDPLDGAEA